MGRIAKRRWHSHRWDAPAYCFAITYERMRSINPFGIACDESPGGADARSAFLRADHREPPPMKQAYVYILASTSRTLYTGVTSDLERRIWQHKTHVHDGFTKRYKVTKLVWFVEFSRIDDAIAFEKSLKGKSRAKKVALIEESNPRWNDLAWDWFAPEDILGLAEDSASRGDSSLRSE